MSDTTLNQQLRGHIWQGAIRYVDGTWQVGIFAPFEDVTNPDWIAELDRMLVEGEIIQVPHTTDIREI